MSTDRTDPVISVLTLLKNQWSLSDSDTTGSAIKFSTGWYDGSIIQPQISVRPAGGTHTLLSLGTYPNSPVYLHTDTVSINVWVRPKQDSNTSIGWAKSTIYKLKEEIDKLLISGSHLDTEDYETYGIPRTWRVLDDTAVRPVVFRMMLTYDIHRFRQQYSPSNLYEYQRSSNETNVGIYYNHWSSQTFTVGAVGPSRNFTLKYIKLRLIRFYDPPGTITVSVRQTDSNGTPTGSDLTSGSLDGSTITNASGGSWYQVDMTSDVSLSAKTTYAIVVCNPSAINLSTALRWYTYSGSGQSVYGGGSAFYSIDWGVIWYKAQYDNDCTFELYGDWWR